jgi:hypothetical protein
MSIERLRLVQVAESIREELLLFPQAEYDLITSANGYGRTPEEVHEALKGLRGARLVHAVGEDTEKGTVYQASSTCGLG